MRKSLIALMILMGSVAHAQITGSSPVTPGQTATYTYAGSAVYGYYTWSISPLNGTVNSTWTSGTTYYASITWTTGGTCTLGFSAYALVSVPMGKPRWLPNPLPSIARP